MTSERPPAHRRLRKFVDRRLQLGIIAALVAAQVVLVAVCIWQLDGSLRAVLEAQTYRIHFQAAPDAVAFREEALRLLALFAMINLGMVLLIELAWVMHVRALLARYRRQLRRIRDADFALEPEPRPSHALLVLADGWWRAERERLLALRQCRLALDAAPADRDGLEAVMARVERALPPTR